MMAQRILRLFLLDQTGPWSLTGGTLSVLGAQESGVLPICGAWGASLPESPSSPGHPA